MLMQGRPFMYGYLTNLKDLIVFKIQSEGRNSRFFESAPISFPDAYPILLSLCSLSEEACGLDYEGLPTEFQIEGFLGLGATSQVFEVKERISNSTFAWKKVKQGNVFVVCCPTSRISNSISFPF